MAYDGPEVEFREVFGMGFMQRRNHIALTRGHLSGPVGSVGKSSPGVEGKSGDGGDSSLPESVQRDMVLSSIALKYTQSNSVGYASSLRFARWSELRARGISIGCCRETHDCRSHMTQLPIASRFSSARMALRSCWFFLSAVSTILICSSKYRVDKTSCR